LSCDTKNVSNYKKLRTNIYNIIELLLETKEIIKIERTKEFAKSNKDTNKKT
jgi:hypothetical protein